jgi:hypothetical protein
MARDVPAAEHLVIRDIAVSWTSYLDAAPSLAPLPPHLLLHLAGPTSEGVRIVELWDSRTAAEAAERPGLAQLERSAATHSAVIRMLDISHTLKGAQHETA